jgi:hypothetical protein
MSAEPVPDPDLGTTVRHVLPQKIDAVAYGLSVMHHDVREIRRTVADHSLRLADLAEGQSTLAEGQRTLAEGQAVIAEGQRKQGEELAAMRESVAEVLRRLPDPGAPDATRT